jgi:hypothetical protein
MSARIQKQKNQNNSSLSLQSSKDSNKRQLDTDADEGKGKVKKQKVSNEIHRGCGIAHPNHEKCFFQNHPNFNKSTTSWLESKQGKAFASRGIYRLPSDKYLPPNLIGDLLILPEEQRPKFHGNKSSKLKHDLLTLDDKNLSRQLSSHKISSIIQCTIVYNNKKLTVNCLVDTGSEQSNFASPRVANWLNQVGASALAMKQSSII